MEEPDVIETIAKISLVAWRGAILRAIEAEPEYPGEMPDKIWRCLATREGAEKAFQASAADIKANISKRVGAIFDRIIEYRDAG